MPSSRLVQCSLFSILTLCLFTQVSCADKKDLWVVDGRFVWGTSKEELQGLEYPDALLSDEKAQQFEKDIRDLGVSGANTVLIRVQSPGNPFFAQDGKSTPKNLGDRLLKVYNACRYISFNPIFVLFDPDPSCRLDSEKAYHEAAKWVVELLREEDGFMLGISDRCDDPRWQSGSPAFEDPGITERVAATIHEASPGRIVVAGATDRDILDYLVGDAENVDALMAPVRKFGYGQGTLPNDKKPVIEMVASKNASDEELKKAIEESLEDGTYAFVLTAGKDQDQEEVRSHLERATDAYMKDLRDSQPPIEGDTFSLQEGEAEEGFISLFNGKNLDGWVILSPEGNFVVENDAIVIKNRAGGWLRSWNRYDNFEFRCEYRIVEGHNSGIFIRAPLNGRSSRIGFEFQILGTPEAEPEINGTGSVYSVRAPDKNMMKPIGEWNDVRILCKGGHLEIVWNGEKVHDLEYDDYEAMKYRTRRGYIGLQDHRGLAEWRNIRIKPLG
jgi:hypothetical protein